MTPDARADILATAAKVCTATYHGRPCERERHRITDQDDRHWNGVVNWPDALSDR